MDIEKQIEIIEGLISACYAHNEYDYSDEASNGYALILFLKEQNEKLRN